MSQLVTKGGLNPSISVSLTQNSGPQQNGSDLKQSSSFRYSCCGAGKQGIGWGGGSAVLTQGLASTCCKIKAMQIQAHTNACTRTHTHSEFSQYLQLYVRISLLSLLHLTATKIMVMKRMAAIEPSAMMKMRDRLTGPIVSCGFRSGEMYTTM